MAPALDPAQGDPTAATLTVQPRPSGRQSNELKLAVSEVVLAGYTGRDRAKVAEHISELEKVGVAAPERIPSVYVVSPHLLTIGSGIMVRSAKTSGEAEFVLVRGDTGLLVGVGSDHTDRVLEAEDVPASKAACPKVLSRDLWCLDDVLGHWDRLILRSWVRVDDKWQLYQDGVLAELLDVDALLAETMAVRPSRNGQVIFGGTLATVGGFVFGEAFEAELLDPVLARRLAVRYQIAVGPDAWVGATDGG